MLWSFTVQRLFIHHRGKFRHLELAPAISLAAWSSLSVFGSPLQKFRHPPHLPTSLSPYAPPSSYFASSLCVDYSPSIFSFRFTRLSPISLLRLNFGLSSALVISLSIPDCARCSCYVVPGALATQCHALRFSLSDTHHGLL